MNDDPILNFSDLEDAYYKAMAGDACPDMIVFGIDSPPQIFVDALIEDLDPDAER